MSASLQCVAQSTSTTHEFSNIKVSGSSYFQGTARFGTLGSTEDAEGLKIEVIQSPLTRLRRVWHQPVINSWTELVPVYGMVDQGWDEEFAHEEYDWVELTPFIPSYTTIEEYQISEGYDRLVSEAIPGREVLVSPGSSPTYRTPDDLNENGIADDGNIDLDNDGVSESSIDQPGTDPVYQQIPEVPAVYEWIPPVYGTRDITVPDQPATYMQVPRRVVDYTVHHESLIEGIIGENRILHEDVVVPGHFSSEILSGEMTPTVRFTGAHPEMTFAWTNTIDTSTGARRDLMTLSTGGVLLPTPGDIWGNSKASFSSESFEQSWTGPEWEDDGETSMTYHSYGTRMGKQMITIWNHGGDYVATEATEGAEVVERVTAKDEVSVTSTGLLIEKTDPSHGNSNSIQATHITADFATFGGGVSVKGVLRVEPAGNLEMGAFTQGPKP